MLSESFNLNALTAARLRVLWYDVKHLMSFPLEFVDDACFCLDSRVRENDGDRHLPDFWDIWMMIL